MLQAAEVVVARAQPSEAQHASETGVAAATGTEIETRTETLGVLGMRRSLVVGVDLEAGVVGEIGIGTGIGRRLVAGAVVRM